MSNLFLRNGVGYKPHAYPQAFKFWEAQQQVHWLAAEVPMDKDINDWKNELTDAERIFLTQIFRFFTQGDIDVAEGYLDKYIPMFDAHPEIRMMLTAFASMETVHIDAYSKLIETVGMPEAEYQAFLQYEEMANKHEYILQFGNTNDVTEIAKALAVYSGFTEGLQLFSSFVMLMNFQRFGLMKGMGQIVTWSVRDESLHVEGMTWLFRTLIQENPHIWTDEFKKEIYDICRKMVELEEAFIDLAFSSGGLSRGNANNPPLTADQVKLFVRHIADRRLLQLGLKPNYGVKDNPIPWYELTLNSIEHTNFFENRATEYSKGTLGGEWSDAFEMMQQYKEADADV